MRPLFTRDEARAFDDAAIAAGVPGIVLMENAARGATEVLASRFADRLERVLLVGGVGLNGGDAWALGRQLLARGLRPTAIVVGDRSAVGGDARTNLDALERLGVEITNVGSEAAAAAIVPGRLATATAIVDGLFGTGLSRPVAGVAAVVVDALAARRVPLLALDLPSGIDADTGEMLGCAIRADVTVTFGAHKRGLLQGEGLERAGEVVLVHIGVPAPGASACVLLEPSDLAAWIPRRARSAHKGTAGHVLVLAGSAGKTGAALLVGHAAMRAGAGLVTLAARGAARAALDQKVVELMTAEIPDALEAGALAVARESEGKRALVVGPGLGLDATSRGLALRVAVDSALPTVLDADALTAIGSDLGLLEQARAPRVLTPHPGEAARLLGCSVADVQRDRHAAAERIAARSGAVVVLKGARTVIAGPGRSAVSGRGTPALGAAGTGDVLAGTIAALLGGTTHAFEAAAAGVLLHALAGERAAIADRGVLAHEVADAIPQVLAEHLGKA